jgi:exonuclease SbcC
VRLLKLRFKNINSLAGQWEIDFDNPQFKEGLFALTGATGAGKTFVLDAICLGFYGQTARQEISKSTNEVMTRGTGDSFAEVDFEVNGKQYRSTWEQHRERFKPNGALQSASRKVASLPDGVFIAERLNDATAKIIELTGMDFKQFTRAVLLAQGQFDAFLKASEKERSAILEQVTGSEIYSKIGAAVFQRWQDEKTKKENLEKGIEYINPLLEEERGAVQKTLDELVGQKIGFAKMLTDLRKQIQWLEVLDKLREDYKNQIAEKNKLDTEMSIAKPEFERLAKALSARKLDVVLQGLEAARKSRTDAGKEQNKRKLASEKYFIEFEAAKPRLEKAEETAGTEKKKLDDALPILNEVRKMDGVISTAKSEQASANESADESKKNLQDANSAYGESAKSLQKSEDEYKTADSYIQANPADDKLKDILPSVESYLGLWNNKKKESGKKERDAEKAEKLAAEKKKILKDADLAVEKAKSDHVKKVEQRKAAEKGKLEAETTCESKKPDIDAKIRLASENLLLTKKLATLEEERGLLSDGKPCPLCGATEHPYAKGNIPELSKAQKELDLFQKELEKLLAAEKDARKVFDKADDEFQKTQAELQAKEAAGQVADLESGKAGISAQAAMKAADESSKEAAGNWTTIIGKLSELGLKEPKPETVAQEVEKLKTRQSEFEKQTKAAQSSKTRIEAAKEAVSKAGKQLEKTKTDYERKCEIRKNKKEKLDLLVGERKKIFSGDPDAEEKQLRKVFEDESSKLIKLKSALGNLGVQSKKAKEEFEAADVLLKEKTIEESSLIQSSLLKFQEAGFTGEADCVSSRWSDEEVARVLKLQKELGDKLVGLNSLLAKSADDTKLEEEKALTDRTLPDLNSDCAEQKAKEETVLKTMAELGAKLKTDDETRSKFADSLVEMEKQVKVFEKWNRLNAWIGGANGEQFKRYAQGITLTHLLKEGNRHLLKMTSGRYEMFWKAEDTSLLPSVIDRHQGDVERPVSNFSGGETFLVSLSLALGLSGLASGRLRIDSLFLDEGFGTLDNQTLDTAVNTLAELHQSQGKLIGVISHIEQMKSQIPTRIEIRKIGGGRSEMSGAGVKKIEDAVDSASNPKPKKRKKE